MVRRFRMIAGPNGSGKSTLRAWLSSDYAVNFYTFLNADDLNAELVRTGRCTVPFAFEPDELSAFVRTTSYDASVKEPFLDGRIVADRDFVRFGPDAVNTYTVALLTAFTHLSRAFFFDNSTDEMRYLASWSRDEGLRVQQTVLPDWFDQVRRVLAADRRQALEDELEWIERGRKTCERKH